MLTECLEKEAETGCAKNVFDRWTRPYRNLKVAEVNTIPDLARTVGKQNRFGAQGMERPSWKRCCPDLGMPRSRRQVNSTIAPARSSSAASQCPSVSGRCQVSRLGIDSLEAVKTSLSLSLSLSIYLYLPLTDLMESISYYATAIT